MGGDATLLHLTPCTLPRHTLVGTVVRATSRVATAPRKDALARVGTSATKVAISRTRVVIRRTKVAISRTRVVTTQALITNLARRAGISLTRREVISNTVAGKVMGDER